jgi:hypothetical protein
VFALFASSASATGINSRDPNSFGQGGEFFVDLGLIGRNSGLLRTNFLYQGSQFLVRGISLWRLRRRGSDEHNKRAKREQERRFHKQCDAQEQFAFP